MMLSFVCKTSVSRCFFFVSFFFRLIQLRWLGLSQCCRVYGFPQVREQTPSGRRRFVFALLKDISDAFVVLQGRQKLLKVIVLSTR